MDFSYYETLSNFWLKIENLNSELPESLLPEVESTILKLNFHLITFNKCITEFHRLAINRSLLNGENKRLSEVKWLFPRDPKTVNNYGRMNLKDQTIFYGSFILATLINEVKPKIGDRVTVSSWRLRDSNTEILVFPTFDPKKLDPNFISAQDLFFEILKSYPVGTKNVLVAQQELLSNVFSKKISIKNNYVFGASIANNIFTKAYDGKIEAIIYPSVQDTSKITNIAIKPRVVLEKYELTSIREYKIINNSDRLKHLEPTGFSKGIRDGIIQWN